ncbi:MAG: hypothetical protein IPP68_06805 [Elusimicrobia bacterium]|nr:hypothetical protein [Elusimicrobiota bacterium]
MRRGTAALAIALAAGTPNLRAADRYVLSVPAAVMAGDAFTLVVGPRSGDQPDAAPQRVKMDLPAGFAPVSAPARGFEFQGETPVTVRTLPTLAPGLYVLTVRHAANKRVLGMAEILVERPATTFTLTPRVRPFVGQVGKPFALQLIARDDRGGAVTSFHSDVNLNASLGTVSPAVLSGDLFHGGIAEAVVTLTASGAADRRNRLEAVSRKIVGGQSSPARGVVDLTIQAIEETP